MYYEVKEASDRANVIFNHPNYGESFNMISNEVYSTIYLNDPIPDKPGYDENYPDLDFASADYSVVNIDRKNELLGRFEGATIHNSAEFAERIAYNVRKAIFNVSSKPAYKLPNLGSDYVRAASEVAIEVALGRVSQNILDGSDHSLSSLIAANVVIKIADKLQIN